MNTYFYLADFRKIIHFLKEKFRINVEKSVPIIFAWLKKYIQWWGFWPTPADLLCRFKVKANVLEIQNYVF